MKLTHHLVCPIKLKTSIGHSLPRCESEHLDAIVQKLVLKHVSGMHPLEYRYVAYVFRPHLRLDMYPGTPHD